MAALLAKVATTAVKTAATDYVTMAKKANVEALMTIPFRITFREHLCYMENAPPMFESI